MEEKKAYFFLGLNGAGKSTIRDIQSFKNVTIIDPDKIKSDEKCSGAESGRKALKLFKECIINNKPFVLESTLTGHTIFKRIEEAKKNGFYINCVYVGLDSVETHINRVKNRVAKGGHSITEDMIRNRYNDSYKNIEKLFSLADKLTILDNTKTLTKQIEFTKGKLKKGNKLKRWVIEKVIRPYEKKIKQKNKGNDREF